MKSTMLNKILLFLFFLSANIFAQSASLSVLNIQGVVRDDKGGAVTDGSYQFVFKIYNVETGGTALWTETQTISVVSGVYSANLGAVNPFTGLGFNVPYYVGISFSGKNEISPRIRLTAAPYALALQGVGNVFPSDGNVGIGTATPTTKLDVNGNTKITGTLQVTSSVNFSSSNTVTTGPINLTNGTGALTAKTATVNGKATITDTLKATTHIDANNLTIDGKAPFTYKIYSWSTINALNGNESGGVGNASEDIDYNTGVSTSGYYAIITGWDMNRTEYHTDNEDGPTIQIVESGGTWHLDLYGHTNSSNSPEWTIRVLFIKRELVSSSF